MDKTFILYLHLVVALFLAYLSYSLINNKPIPKFIGFVLGFLAVLVVGAHIYLYTQKNSSHVVVQQGINFRGDDSTYDIIGGAGGGGWV